MRIAEFSRKTKETEIYVKVNLDGIGNAEIKMDNVFCAHMLTAFAVHSLIDITINAKGDLKHHIIEDLAICLGTTIRKALDTTSITRYGYAIVPMDCSLAYAAIDLSGRPYAAVDLKLDHGIIEDMPSEDIHHFLETLSVSLMANLHILIQYGKNNHHKAEAAFKALALSLRQAISLDPKRKDTPSSKGVL